MYVYEYDNDDRLARVLSEDLPQQLATNPDAEALRHEVLAQQHGIRHPGDQP